MTAVVDTNVAIAANGRNTHASLVCQLKCIEFLEQLVKGTLKQKIAVDALGLIFDEYGGHFHFRGAPGVGDMFFKFLHDNMHVESRVTLAKIMPVADDSRGFEELEVNKLDKSDRKFAAVAKVTNAKIFNALDTDWMESQAFLNSSGIHVVQLCPDHCKS